MRQVWNQLVDPVFPNTPDTAPTFDWATVGWISLWTVILIGAYELTDLGWPRLLWASLGWGGALFVVCRAHGTRFLQPRLFGWLAVLLLAQHMAYDIGWRALYRFTLDNGLLDRHWLAAWSMRTAWRWTSLLLVPGLGALLLGASLADVGARRRAPPAFNLWPILAGLYAVAVPTLFWAATQPSFLRTYPRVLNFPSSATPSISEGVAFETLYGMGFAATEGFWRGLVLFPLMRFLGPHAVVFAAVGYTVAHFSKPPLEVLISLPGGFVTGWLAAKHGTFWPFIVLHVAVALTMEVLCLLRM